MLYQIYELIGGSWNLIRRIPDGDEATLITALESASSGPWPRLFTAFRAAGRRIVGTTDAGDRLVKTRWDRRGFRGQQGRVVTRPLPWGHEGFITTDWGDIGLHGPVEVVPRSSARPSSPMR